MAIFSILLPNLSFLCHCDGTVIASIVIIIIIGSSAESEWSPIKASFERSFSLNYGIISLLYLPSYIFCSGHDSQFEPITLSVPRVFALKHESRILGDSFNPVCVFSMIKQVRLCAVWPLENWLGSSVNHIQGWRTVRESYARALEQGPLSEPLPSPEGEIDVFRRCSHQFSQTFSLITMHRSDSSLFLLTLDLIKCISCCTEDLRVYLPVCECRRVGLFLSSFAAASDVDDVQISVIKLHARSAPLRSGETAFASDGKTLHYSALTSARDASVRRGLQSQQRHRRRRRRCLRNGNGPNGY